MSKILLTGGMLVLPLLCCGQGQPPKSNNWWDREFWSRLTTSGQRTLGYQSFKFEGDREAFGSLTNYGTGLQHFTDIGNLSVQGNKVFGLLDFRATFTDNRFSDPEQQQYTLNYRKGDYDVSYGTVQASLTNSNRFVNFSRSLNGFVGGYKSGKLESKLISSEARGAARTVTIEGNNTSGPFYLQSGRIIGGSVRVILDGTELRQGLDYLVDTGIGSITFTDRIIAPTSTLVASYESYDVSGSGGSIRGAGLTYDLGPMGKIGVTGVEQRLGNGTTSSRRIDSFQGFGSPGNEYPLQFQPNPAKPIIVKIDGLVRVFSLVPNTGEFFLSQVRTNVIVSRIAVPDTQTLQIEYEPILVQSVDGNRKVTGIDWRIPVGSKGSGSYMTYTRANGELDGATPSSGGAEALDLRLSEGKGVFRMGVRRIDPGFRTIEQTGFNRNEDATEYGYDYSTKGFTSSLKTGNNLISISNGSSTTSSRLMNTELALRYTDPKNVAKNLTHNQAFTLTQTRVLAADDNRLNSLAYRDDYRYKKLSFGYGLENQTGKGRVNGTLTGLGVNTYRTNATYDAGKNWTISANAGKSFVRTDTIKSEGYDYSLRASMAQTGPWSGGMDYTLSDSGLLASLGGFLNGNSLGYGTGGFGNTGGNGVISTGQLKARRTAFNIRHQAGDRITLDLAYSNTLSQGTSTSNSRIDTLSLSTNWKINEAHSLIVDFMQVKSNFLTGLNSASNSDVISGYLMGNPRGNLWSYNVGYNLLRSTGSQLSQDNFGLSGDINYRLNPRQSLFFNANINQTRGLYPQNDRSAQAGYRYLLGAGLVLVGKYSFRDLRNLDPSAVGGAFRANGFSVELTFDLSNRR